MLICASSYEGNFKASKIFDGKHEKFNFSLLISYSVLKINIEGLPPWTEQAFAVLISVTVGVLAAMVVQLILVPRLRRKLQGMFVNTKCKNKQNFIEYP